MLHMIPFQNRAWCISSTTTTRRRAPVSGVRELPKGAFQDVPRVLKTVPNNDRNYRHTDHSLQHLPCGARAHMEKPAHRQRQTSREHTADQPPGLLWSEDCPYAADATPYERAGHLRLELLRASEGLRSTCNPQGEQYSGTLQLHFFPIYPIFQ